MDHAGRDRRFGAMRLRSPLFAPGDSARKAEKALASDADAVILDLEDSVAASGKEAARAAVAAMLPGLVRPGVIVRINPKFHRPAEVELLIGDASKAKEKLGWKPKTTLEQLCKMMVEEDLRRNKAGFSF